MSTLRVKNFPITVTRWFAAELLGTMLLAATAGLATIAHLGLINGYTSLYIPFAVGAVVMVLVYLLGSVSGCHLNPAVTIGLFAFRKISLTQLVSDLVAQFIGAWLGVQLIVALIGIGPSAPVYVNSAASTGELIGAFVLVFAVASVVIGQVKAELSGVVIGAALMIGLTLSMATGAGVLNPAVATAFGAPMGVTYLLMPLLGGLIGTAAAILFNSNKQ